MKIKLLALTLFLSSILTGCALNSAGTPPSVDNRSLGRSMIYTQRELLAIELAHTAATEQQRHSTLVKSYCDLTDRTLIYVTKPPTTCETPLNNPERTCIAYFHQCVGTCDVRSGQCHSCEIKANTCLKETSDLRKLGTL